MQLDLSILIDRLDTSVALFSLFARCWISAASKSYWTKWEKGGFVLLV